MKHKKSFSVRLLPGVMVLCLCAALLLGSAMPAHAASATITIHVDDTRLLQELNKGAKVSLSLYKIAGRSGSAWNYAEAPAFAGLSGRINAYELALQRGITPDLSVLSGISAVIASSGVIPVATRSFSADGRVTFDGLSEGLYFFAMAVGPELLTIQSAIVPVPYTFKGAVLPSGIVTTAKVEWGTVPPPPPPSPPPYRPPVNPNPPAPPVNPPVPQQGEIIIDDYDTPLGIAIETNHVGDCYE